MSWYGTHAQFPKALVKSLLPPRACKHCVYWLRTAIGSSPGEWYQIDKLCPRCGLPQGRLLAKLNELLLGHEPVKPASPRECPASLLPKSEKSPTRAETDPERAIRLYKSPNVDISLRAAGLLVQRADTPLPVLLDVLDRFALAGLGAPTQKALLKRHDADLVAAMIARTTSPYDFTREVACTVLGKAKDRTATPYLLQALDDPAWGVRRAAAFAMLEMNDPASVPSLKQQWIKRRYAPADDVWALRLVLQSLGVEFGDE